ncbi:MAG: D-alanyl-D-alanine carboxypeptidase/D-alanyl-D-alanine-endopeptidase, partial [Pseudomonadota bacterium]
GLRYGISVIDLDGNILESHRADERFMPASNVKLFITAAALIAERDLNIPNSGTRVALESNGTAAPNLILIGRGDPTVGSGQACQQRCLEGLAASVAQSGIQTVGDIIGDDSWFADERRPLGWSWDDLKFGHGTAISALSVNDNVVQINVSPSELPGLPVRADWSTPEPHYFDLLNEAITSKTDGEWALRVERRIGERSARLYGELPAGARPVRLFLGVDNPAHMAAWSFRHALEAKGVLVRGSVKTRRRPLQYADEPKAVDPANKHSPRQCVKNNETVLSQTIIASLPAAPFQDIITDINRDSQNLHAEVLLRQLGRASGTGSSFCGLLQIEQILDTIGVPRSSYDIADGSGLSSYNRATPEAITTLLHHAATAPWADAFQASLPVGGQTGTLRHRFRGTALDGKIFAKTGTLNHVDALSGFMQAKSGKTLIFSIIVNDRPLESRSAASQIDATLLSIAARH